MPPPSPSGAMRPARRLGSALIIKGSVSNHVHVFVETPGGESVGLYAQGADVAFRRVRRTIKLERVLEAVAREFGMAAAEVRRRRRGDVARGIAARMLARYAGLNQRDTAAWLGYARGARSACS